MLYLLIAKLFLSAQLKPCSAIFQSGPDNHHESTASTSVKQVEPDGGLPAHVGMGLGVSTPQLKSQWRFLVAKLRTREANSQTKISLIGDQTPQHMMQVRRKTP
jgi:hypothetical protein